MLPDPLRYFAYTLCFIAPTVLCAMIQSFHISKKEQFDYIENMLFSFPYNLRCYQQSYPRIRYTYRHPTSASRLHTIIN
ncbi:unnamed protein product [Caenorhabditis nigoni]